MARFSPYWLWALLAVPGLGMINAAFPGELLISLGPPNLPWLVGAPWAGPGQPAPIEIPIPDDEGKRASRARKRGA